MVPVLRGFDTTRLRQSPSPPRRGVRRRPPDFQAELPLPSLYQVFLSGGGTCQPLPRVATAAPPATTGATAPAPTAATAAGRQEAVEGTPAKTKTSATTGDGQEAVEGTSAKTKGKPPVKAPRAVSAKSKAIAHRRSMSPRPKGHETKKAELDADYRPSRDQPPSLATLDGAERWSEPACTSPASVPKESGAQSYTPRPHTPRY